MMTNEEFHDAMQSFADDGKRWPHDLKPLTRATLYDEKGMRFALEEHPGDVTKEQWEQYDYNPPEFAKRMFPEADLRPDVRPKPSWQEVLDGGKRQMFEEGRANSLSAIGFECTHRVNLALGARDYQHSIRKQIRGDVTPAQLVERDRLRAVHKAQVKLVEAMTAEQLAEYDPSADAIWIDE